MNDYRPVMQSKDESYAPSAEVVVKTGTQSQSVPRAMATVLGLCCTGLWFGALFERSHVFEPTSIRQQFIFGKWIMIKMFMGAVAGAAFSFSLIGYFDPSRFQLMREKNLSVSYTSVTLGSVLLGFGMCTAGACPGMVLPQVGTFVDNSWATLLGGFVGALVFNGLALMGVSQRLQKVDYATAEEQMKAEYVDLRFGLDGKIIPLMIGFGVFAASVAAVIEILVPFRDELLDYSGGRWKDGAWPPSLCGMGIGCVNIMTALLVEDSIGSAKGYAQIAGKECLADPRTCGPSLVNIYWQVPYLASAVLGAFLSAYANDNFPNETPGIGEVWIAFLGGFMMLFGSRIGSGCTSGHGIAGMPMLNIKSIVGCCAMFAGGIALGIILETQDSLSLQ